MFREGEEKDELDLRNMNIYGEVLWYFSGSGIDQFAYSWCDITIKGGGRDECNVGTTTRYRYSTVLLLTKKDMSLSCKANRRALTTTPPEN